VAPGLAYDPGRRRRLGRVADFLPSYSTAMDVGAWWAQEGLEQQLLQAVDYAAQAVYQLPDYIGHPDLASPLHFAAIDSYLVNLRLLMDFWDVRQHGHDGRDFYATDFIVDWVPRPADSVESLRRDNWWEMASQQIVHMSRRRVVPGPHDPTWSPRWETNAEAAAELSTVADYVRAIQRIWLRLRTQEIERRVAIANAAQS
jgi:hypothetical protein